MTVGLYEVPNPASSEKKLFAPCIVGTDTEGQKIALTFTLAGVAVWEFDEAKFKPADEVPVNTPANVPEA